MADDIAGDVGGEGAGSIGSDDLGGGEPAAGLDIAEIEATFNAQLTGADAPEGSEDGSGAAKADKGRVRSFIEKNYGGDEDAFLASTYSQREEAKRLAATVKELQEIVKNPPAPRDIAAEIKNAVASDPDAQAIDQRITAVDFRIKQIDRDQVELATSAGQVNNKIGQLEAQIQGANEEDRPRLYSELNRYRNEMRSINAEWKANSLGKDNSADLLETLRHQRGRVVREVREAMAREEQSKADDASKTSRIRMVYDKSYEVIATQSGIDPESDFGKSFNKVVRSQVADHIDTLPDGLDDPVELYKITQQIANTLIKQLGINPRGAGAPKTRQAITPRTTMVPKRSVNTAGQPYVALPNTSTGDPLDDPNLSPKQRGELARKQARNITEQLIKHNQRQAVGQ